MKALASSGERKKGGENRVSQINCKLSNLTLQEKRLERRIEEELFWHAACRRNTRAGPHIHSFLRSIRSLTHSLILQRAPVAPQPIPSPPPRLPSPHAHLHTQMKVSIDSFIPSLTQSLTHSHTHTHTHTLIHLKLAWEGRGGSPSVLMPWPWEFAGG